MDRQNLYTLCFNAKWCCLTSCIAVALNMIIGMCLRTIAGEVMVGIGFMVLPMIGCAAYFLHLLTYAFAPPAEATKQTHTP